MSQANGGKVYYVDDNQSPRMPKDHFAKCLTTVSTKGVGLDLIPVIPVNRSLPFDSRASEYVSPQQSLKPLQSTLNPNNALTIADNTAPSLHVIDPYNLAKVNDHRTSHWEYDYSDYRDVSHKLFSEQDLEPAQCTVMTVVEQQASKSVVVVPTQAVPASSFYNYKADVGKNVQQRLAQEKVTQDRLKYSNAYLHERLEDYKSREKLKDLKFEELSAATETKMKDTNRKVEELTCESAHLKERANQAHTESSQHQIDLTNSRTMVQELRQQLHTEKLRNEACVMNVRRLQQMYDEEVQLHLQSKYEASKDLTKSESYYMPQLSTLNVRIATQESTIVDLQRTLTDTNNRREQLEMELKSQDERVEMLMADKNNEIKACKQRVSQQDIYLSELKYQFEQDNLSSFHRGVEEGRLEGTKLGRIEGEELGRLNGQEHGFVRGKVQGFQEGYKEGEEHGKCISDNEYLVKINGIRTQDKHNTELLELEIKRLEEKLAYEDQERKRVEDRFVHANDSLNSKSGEYLDLLKKHEDLNDIFNTIQKRLSEVEGDNKTLQSKYDDVVNILKHVQESSVPVESLKSVHALSLPTNNTLDKSHPLQGKVLSLSSTPRVLKTTNLSGRPKNDDSNDDGGLNDVSFTSTLNQSMSHITPIHPLAVEYQHGPRLEAVRQVFDLYHLHSLHSRQLEQDKQVLKSIHSKYTCDNTIHPSVNIYELINRPTVCMNGLYNITHQFYTILQLIDRHTHNKQRSTSSKNVPVVSDALSREVDEMASLLSHASHSHARCFDRLQSLIRAAKMEVKDALVKKHLNSNNSKSKLKLVNPEIQIMSKLNKTLDDEETIANDGVSKLLSEELMDILLHEEAYLPLLKQRMDEISQSVMKVFGHLADKQQQQQQQQQQSASMSGIRKLNSVMHPLSKTHPNNNSSRHQPLQKHPKQLDSRHTSARGDRSARGLVDSQRSGRRDGTINSNNNTNTNSNRPQRPLNTSALPSARSSAVNKNRGGFETEDNNNNTGFADMNAISADNSSNGLKSGEEQLMSSIIHMKGLVDSFGLNPHNTNHNNYNNMQYSSESVGQYEDYPLHNAEIADHMERERGFLHDEQDFLTRAERASNTAAIMAGTYVDSHTPASSTASVTNGVDIPSEEEAERIHRYWMTQAPPNAHGVPLAAHAYPQDPERYKRHEYY